MVEVNHTREDRLTALLEKHCVFTYMPKAPGGIPQIQTSVRRLADVMADIEQSAMQRAVEAIGEVKIGQSAYEALEAARAAIKKLAVDEWNEGQSHGA